MPVWSFQVHETMTGLLRLTVEPSEGSWTRRLNGGGQGQHKFVLRGGDLSPAVARDLFRPNASTLAVLWDGVPVYAGVIVSTTYDRAAGVLTVSHAELRMIWAQRLTFGVSNYVDGDLTVTNRNLSGAARAVIARGMAWGTIWQLPVDLPADGSGTFSAQWKRYQCLTIEDLLAQLESEGCEIDFRPYLTGAGVLRWQTRIGAPGITSGAFDLPITPDGTAVVDLTVTTDGARQVTGAFFVGNGTEADMLTAFSTGLGALTIPVRDAYRSAKDVTSVTQLTRLAVAEVQANWLPVTQWSFAVTLGDYVSPTSLLPGVVVAMDARGDDWIADGKLSQRVIGLSGDMTLKVKPEVQPYG